MDATFLFADLAGFTALTEAHGDEPAADLAEEFCTLVRELLADYDAQELKVIGDAIMLRVARADDAVALGLKIVSDVGMRHGTPAVRVGMHTGPAVERRGDWFGTTVNLAARVAAVARGGEVLLTQATKHAAGQPAGVELTSRGSRQFRNITQATAIYAASPLNPRAQPRWPIDPVCRMAVDPTRNAGVLEYAGREYSFCSLKCASAFAETPDRYAQNGDGMSTSPTEPEIRNPLFARFYARVLEPLSKRDRNRERLLADLDGRVLELGCGAGINFPLYTSAVSEVIAVEPEPYLRGRAQQAAATANVPIKVVAGQANRLPLEDSSVDRVVCSLVLCSVADPASALAELHRVLRPGGALHFYEHVVAHNPAGRALQRAADATFWPHAFGNCHTTRDTRSAIEQAGFQIERCKRLVFPDTEPPLPHILGIARRAQ